MTAANELNLDMLLYDAYLSFHLSTNGDKIFSRSRSQYRMSTFLMIGIIWRGDRTIHVR